MEKIVRIGIQKLQTFQSEIQLKLDQLNLSLDFLETGLMIAG